MIEREFSGFGAAGGKPSGRSAELIRKLVFEIEIARLPPGETLSFAILARRLRCRPQDLPPVVEEAQRRGLLTVSGEECTIVPLDRAALPALLDRRLQLEQHVADRAANRAAPLDEDEVRHASELMSRSALLGDIEGFMEAGRRLDRAFWRAAALPEVGAEITALKGEFRRAWCAYNRLRDLNAPAAYRRAVAEAVMARNPEAARAHVGSYIDCLRRSF